MYTEYHARVGYHVVVAFALRVARLTPTAERISARDKIESHEVFTDFGMSTSDSVVAMCLWLEPVGCIQIYMSVPRSMGSTNAWPATDKQEVEVVCLTVGRHTLRAPLGIW